jgi:hypothetical protein
VRLGRLGFGGGCWLRRVQTLEMVLYFLFFRVIFAEFPRQLFFRACLLVSKFVYLDFLLMK